MKQYWDDVHIGESGGRRKQQLQIPVMDFFVHNPRYFIKSKNPDIPVNEDVLDPRGSYMIVWWPEKAAAADLGHGHWTPHGIGSFKLS